MTDDLWREIDAVTPMKTIKISDIAHDFTLQAGVPMIDVTMTPTAYTLTQSRFGLDAEDQTPRTWRVPVSWGPSYCPPPTVKTICDPVWFRSVISAQRSHTTDTPFGGAIINSRPASAQVGYFRTRYDQAAFAQVAAGYPALDPYDQLGIFNDTGSEALAGDVPMADLLDLTTRLPADADPVVEAALVRRLSDFDKLYDGLPGQARFRAFALSRLRPVYSRIGWDATAGEAPNTETLRTALLATLGRLGDAQVVSEAKSRFARLVAGQTLAPAERQAVLGVVAVNADAMTWDQIHTLAKTARSDLEKRQYYERLGDARDHALARRALSLALSGEPAPTIAPEIISAVSRPHPALALQFVSDHWAEVSPMLDSSARGAFAPRLVDGGADPQLAQALTIFGDTHLSPDARGEIPKVLATIAYNAEVRADRLPEVDRWLAARVR